MREKRQINERGMRDEKKYIYILKNKMKDLPLKS
jgi:hypothetical protein